MYSGEGSLGCLAALLFYVLCPLVSNILSLASGGILDKSPL